MMSEDQTRMTDPEGPPSPEQLEAWLGPQGGEYWIRLTDLIARDHPGVFEPDWLYGGKKHGWSLRYKKSKSYCTLIPEKSNLRVRIVFGAKERAQAETILETLSGQTRAAYKDATTYHDGKWLLLTLDSETGFSDIEKLLAVKRRPKPGRTDQR